MAGKATSFVVGLETENDSNSQRETETKKEEKENNNLLSVLRSKYCSGNEEFKFGYFGGRPPKKRTISGGDAELGYLTNVCVSNSNIRTSASQGQSIRSLCPNVVDLDISGNLLDSWSEILPLIQELQNLKFLNIARNPIANNKDTLYEWSSPLPNVENLVLNRTGIKWKDVLQFAKLLPHLKELHLCANNFRDIPEGKHLGLRSVECLRMNDNHITSWDEVWKLRHLPGLKSLILSGNPLVDIHYKAGDLDPDCNCSCHETVTVDDITAVDSDKVNDNHDGDAVKLDDATVANSDDVIESLQEEVRQYCENILNSVIDEAIRNDIAQSSVLQGNDEESMMCEQEENSPTTSIGVVECSERPKDQLVDSGSESLFDIKDKEDQECLKQLSREIVELILRRAFDVVVEEAKVESAAETNAKFDPEMNQKDADCADENKENNELKNGEGTDGKGLNSGDDSCCLCDEEPVSQKPFISLETLCVSETKIGKWKHLSALRTFPALKSVRMKNVKLGSKLSDEDRRKLFMASLPNVKLLNGSEVTPSEREKSERFLLRHFYDKKLKPDIYHTLEKRHGQLTPLVDVDISKGLTDYVTVRFIHNGKLAFTETISVRSMADTLRNLIAKKIDESTMYAVLNHKRCNTQHNESVGEFQEIRGGLLPISRLEILDGDEIHIDDTKSIPNLKVDYYLRDRQPDVKENA
ncbi:tubulin-specific chaperone cofactor E-like protein [Ruditapes philippinarum]|uniref:tubulin-specific chaperone cofactor E-like protein n=1 Tax=Ruditapes philippinarum TaxID=129788 RepID=UPI00295AAF8F|nr:tubulin-specific chaperone cofactor E-like protein [Ruditapes philippinarum]